MDNLSILHSLYALFVETPESIKNNISVRNESSFKSFIKFFKKIIDK